MDRTVVTRVDPVSTTPSVTMSTVAVYRGVVLDIRETSVQKVNLANMQRAHMINLFFDMTIWNVYLYLMLYASNEMTFKGNNGNFNVLFEL